AALPEAWVTPNETVLIHAGASGFGTAAIQLVRLSRAIQVVTAGKINYKKEDFSEKVLQFTEGKGADVILDCVGGSFWEKNICSLAIDGRWVLYGMLGGKTADGDLLGKLLRKRGHLLCSLLRSRRLQYKAELVQSFTEQVLPHFQSTDPPLQPVIDSMFNMEDVEMAHQASLCKIVYDL
uniref:Tumor protein p53 inducible protein 3 n=1 Tax=Sinocyclocheilus rhinocerous TaxID=307959 RepID=A0A673LA28_9TELE